MEINTNNNTANSIANATRLCKAVGAACKLVDLTGDVAPVVDALVRVCEDAEIVVRYANCVRAVISGNDADAAACHRDVNAIVAAAENSAVMATITLGYVAQVVDNQEGLGGAITRLANKGAEKAPFFVDPIPHSPCRLPAAEAAAQVEDTLSDARSWLDCASMHFSNVGVDADAVNAIDGELTAALSIVRDIASALRA